MKLAFLSKEEEEEEMLVRQTETFGIVQKPRFTMNHKPVVLQQAIRTQTFYFLPKVMSKMQGKCQV